MPPPPDRTRPSRPMSHLTSPLTALHPTPPSVWVYVAAYTPLPSPPPSFAFKAFEILSCETARSPRVITLELLIRAMRKAKVVARKGERDRGEEVRGGEGRGGKGGQGRRGKGEKRIGRERDRQAEERERERERKKERENERGYKKRKRRMRERRRERAEKCELNAL